MRTFLYLFLLAAAVSCAPHGNKKNALKGSQYSEEDQVLVGDIRRNDLLAPPHDVWFNAYYDKYQPDHEDLEVIKSNLKEFDSIRVFMGTWCIDSRREIPKLFKILDESDFDYEKVYMTGVELNKTAPDNLQDSYGMIMVPTIIFYKDDRETNRFVEFPRETFEKDIARIVSGKEYRHSYLE